MRCVTVEANASLRSIEHRLTGETYREYVKQLAAAADVDVTDPRAVTTFDRKRKGRKTSNAEWQNPHDPDAKIGPDKKGVTRMIYKPEHIVDLETGAIVDVEVNVGDQRDAQSLADHLLDAEERLNVAIGEPDIARVQTVVADMAYSDPTELGRLQDLGIRTAIADPVRNRQKEKLTKAAQRVLAKARLTTRSASGRAWMRKRGELEERSFEHVLDNGGARRTTLRGRTNILKRYRVQSDGRQPVAADAAPLRHRHVETDVGGDEGGPARRLVGHSRPPTIAGRTPDSPLPRDSDHQTPMAVISCHSAIGPSTHPFFNSLLTQGPYARFSNHHPTPVSNRVDR